MNLRVLPPSYRALLGLSVRAMRLTTSLGLENFASDCDCSPDCGNSSVRVSWPSSIKVTPARDPSAGSTGDPFAATVTVAPDASSKLRRVLVSASSGARRRTVTSWRSSGSPGVRSSESVFSRGRRTVNVAPRPLPRLSTATVPPCRSTNCLTTVRPSPSPPCVARQTAFALPELIEHVRQEGRLDAGAGIFDGQHGVVAARRRA